MRNVVLSLVLLATPGVCLVGSSNAWAERDSLTLTNCTKSVSGDTMGLISCYSDETDRQNKALNDVYHKLNVLLPPEAKTDLVEAERAWLRFRDAECLFQAVQMEGSVGRIHGAECVMGMTRARVQVLQEYLDEQKAQ